MLPATITTVLGHIHKLPEGGCVWPGCREGQASLLTGCWGAGGVVDTAGGLGVGFLYATMNNETINTVLYIFKTNLKKL